MNELGNIRISDDVVKTIAAKAASDRKLDIIVLHKTWRCFQ